MGVAASAGIPQPPADTEYNCPSGDCTWPSFRSLGICTSCVQVAVTNVSCRTIHKPSFGHQSISLCIYTVPAVGRDYFHSGLHYDARYDNIEVWNVVSYDPVDGLFTSNLLNVTYTGPGSSGHLASLTGVRFERYYNSSNIKTAQEILPETTRCDLNWCVNTYAASKLENGKLYDAPSSSVRLIVNTKSCQMDGRYIPLLYFCYPIDETPPEMSFNKRGYYESCYSQPKPKGTYWLNAALVEDLGTELASTLTAKLYSDTFLNLSPWPEPYRTEDETYIEQPSAAVLYAANNGNFSQTMENVATSMTNYIRQASNSTNVEGSVMGPIVYIQVKWPWLLYPAAICACWPSPCRYNI